jgi:hypothetical protein
MPPFRAAPAAVSIHTRNGRSSSHEQDFGKDACFEIKEIEQIKGIPKGRGKVGNLGYFDRLRIPIIENTAQYVEDQGV